MPVLLTEVQDAADAAVAKKGFSATPEDVMRQVDVSREIAENWLLWAMNRARVAAWQRENLEAR